MENTLYLEVIKSDKPLLNIVSVDGTEYELQDSMKINLSFNEIEQEIGSKVVSLMLRKNNKEITHKFEVLEGDNYGILFTSHGKTRDLIFREADEIKVKIGNDKNIEKILPCHNGVKRLLLINLSYDIPVFINDKEMSSDLIDIANEKSIQVSVVNIEQGIFLYKEIIEKDYNIALDFYENSYKKLEEFHSFFKKQIDSCNIPNDKMMQQFNNLKEIIDIVFMKINLPRNILKKYYNDIKYFEFTSLCSLFHVLKEFFAKKKSLDEIRKIYFLFLKQMEIIEKDANLENYQKMSVIIEIGIIIVAIGNYNEFMGLNFSYYLVKNFKPNSIGDCSMKFLKLFIDCLTEKSPFYFPLALIDSGLFTYKGDNIYGYGLLNKDILIKHLKAQLPEVIYSYFDKEHIEIGITNKASECVIVNMALIFKNFEEINIDKEINEKEILYNYSLKMIIILFHQILGHNKAGYNSEINSPNRFFDKEGKNLMILRHKNSYEKGENIINILQNEKSKQNSRYFLEYFFGECKSGFIIDLFETLLFNDVDMKYLYDIKFFNDKIDALRKYVELKYLVFKENKKLLDSINCETIDEEILALEKIVKDNNIKLNEKKHHLNLTPQLGAVQINKNQFISEEDIKKVDYNYYLDRPSEEIREKMKDSNIPIELRRILTEILLSRIRKK